MSNVVRRHQRDTRPVAAPRIAVIGHCAAGKSTLVNGLRDAGIDAHASAQEHSVVPHLWRHLHPDLLIFLDVDLETVQQRRGGAWPATIFSVQERRLALARTQADLEIQTSQADAGQTLEQALALAEAWRKGEVLQSSDRDDLERNAG
jgi:hypothetical protein